MNSENYGFASLDSSRVEGRETQQEERQGNLQHEACASAGSFDGKQARDRLVVFENSANHSKPFIVQKVSTAEELRQRLYDMFPRLDSESLSLRIWNGRMGIIGRTCFEGDLPFDVFDLYVSLHLKKHPLLPVQ